MTRRLGLRVPRSFVWVGCLLLFGMACGGRAESTRAGSDSAGSDSTEYAPQPGTGGASTTRHPKQPTAPAPSAGTFSSGGTFSSAPTAGTFSIAPTAGTSSSTPTPSPSDFGGTFSGPTPTAGAAGVSGGNGGVAGLPPDAAAGETGVSAGGAANDCLHCNQAFSQSSLNVCPRSLPRWQAFEKCLCAQGGLSCDAECAQHALCSHVDGGGLTPACGTCLDEHCRAAEDACLADD